MQGPLQSSSGFCQEDRSIDTPDVHGPVPLTKQQQKLEVYPAVMVLGNGAAALKAVQALSRQQPVILVDRGSLPKLPGVTCYAGYAVAAVKGNAGRFNVTLQGPNRKQQVRVCGIVLALATSKFIDPGLKVPQNQGIIGLSRFCYTNSADWQRRAVAFVLGSEDQAFVSTASALQYALELREKYATSVDIFFQEMKVAAPGLESLYQRARAAGVRFNRYREKLEVHGNVLGVNITYHDPMLADAEPLRLLVDLVVAGEVDQPAPETAALSKILQIELGPQGFFQADNLQLLPVNSNRAGIYYVGSCHHPIHALELEVEARVVAAKLAQFAPGCVSVPQSHASVDSNKCAICLTCYQHCPHGAVQIHSALESVHIDPLACQGCGTCATACPAQAIEIPSLVPQQALDGVKRDLVIFACQNSFIKQDYLAKLAPLTVQVIRVACAGQIDPTQVLQALAAGAEGVLLLTCVPGNCQHAQGYLWAEQRLKRIRDILSLAGISPFRVQSAAVAGNDWRRTLRAVAKLTESFRLGVREGEEG